MVWAHVCRWALGTSPVCGNEVFSHLGLVTATERVGVRSRGAV